MCVNQSSLWVFSIMLFTLLGLHGCATAPPKMEIIAQARALADRGENDKAFELLENAIAADKHDMVVANYYRALIVQRNKEDRSISFFKKLVQEPDVPDATYYNAAFAYIDKIPRVGPMGAGFLSKRSIAQFRAVADRRPDDWIANYGIGMNYLHWPDYFKKNESSISYFEKCLEVQSSKPFKPQYILTFIRYGDALVRSDQIDQAHEIWRAGEALFPGHQDLVDRLNVPKARIADAIKELYNPNNSIGAINTDVAILWATAVPREAVPLRRNALNQAGIGGLLHGAGGGAATAEAGLFSWFTRNLPFLSDKASYSKVDMSPLGVKPSKSRDDLINLVAHGMIRGFLAELEGGEVDQIRKKADEMDGFSRPFFHEGVGMGYAATLSVEDVSELEKFLDLMNVVDAKYARLHLAGAGMWFGLENANSPEKVRRTFAQLGPFGEAYAYEGYGFARMLFYGRSNPDSLKFGDELTPHAAHNFYHGVGRAFWILNGADLAGLKGFIEPIQADYRGDVYSGFGMGISFTRPADPRFVLSLVDQTESAGLNRADYLGGVTMGYVIRNMADPEYGRMLVDSFNARERCRIAGLLQLGQESLAETDREGGDRNANWRGRMVRRFGDEAATPTNCG